MKTDDFNFDDINFNVDFGNFDPSDIQTDETINAVFIVDVSPSVESYVGELNYAFNDFVEAMQKSHVADRLFASVMVFNSTVSVLSGFQPISFIPRIDFSKHIGYCTALYDAAMAGLRCAIDYRTNLQNSGVETKTLIFIITDGEDNSSKTPARNVKREIEKIKSNEFNAFSFTTVLFGVGNQASFKDAQVSMGIDHLAVVGTTGADMKKMIGFISQSISSTALGQRVPPIDF